jgi:hypothetical protein
LLALRRESGLFAAPPMSDLVAELVEILSPERVLSRPEDLIPTPHRQR